jgi:glycosyltransferase involved in cell wall biosynthesis
MESTVGQVDVVMLGTFAVWSRGTLQARTLPLMQALNERGVRCALVTTPWDMSSAAGVVELHGQIPLVNTHAHRPHDAPRAVAEQVSWVRRLRPQLVHVYKPKGFGGLAGRLLLGRMPVIVDSDDWEGDGGWNDQAGYGLLERRLFDWQERDLQRRADAVTAASTLLQRRAVALRAGNPARVLRLPNGLPPAWISALSTTVERQPTERKILLYSRFAEFPADWLPRYLHALATLAAAPITISIVGAIPASARAQLRESRSVKLEQHGYVARERLPALLSDAALAIYPYSDSLIARSKQSVKLLELMAAGVPVIASNVGDAAPTIGDAGLVLASADHELFATASLALLEQPARRAAMRAAGPRRVRARFSFEQLTSQLLDLYAQLGLR